MHRQEGGPGAEADDGGGGAGAGAGTDDDDGGGRLRTVTFVVLGVVAMFLVCHGIRFSYVLVECYVSLSGASEVTARSFFGKLSDSLQVNDWLLLLNSSCNIVVYGWRDPKFREGLRDVLLMRRTGSNVSQIL